MKNAYLDALNGIYPKEYKDIIEGLENKIIPEKHPEVDLNRVFSSELGMASLAVRDKIVSLSGYALVAYEWVRPLSKWIGGRKCLEIMAGSGILSKALQDCGVDIITTDNFMWEEKEPTWFSDSFTEIENLNCIDAIEKYGKNVDIIVCSWPNYEDDSAYKALLKMHEVNPDLIMIYIGEGQGGCTAEDNFYETVEYIEDSSFDEAVKNFKQCFGIHDYPRLCR